MGLLTKLAPDANVAVADERDSVGSGGVLETGLYNTTVNLAYLMKSTGGAVGLVLHLKTDTQREIRQTLWVASGDAKGNKTYFEQKDGTKSYLPGYNHANSLALLTVGKELSQLETETRVVNVWDTNVKAETPQKVECPVELIGQEIIVGLIKQTVDKNVKTDAGTYVPSGEFRDENEIDKFFRSKDRMTTAEIKAEATEPTFIKTWADKWNGTTRDKRAKQSGAAGAPGGTKLTPVGGTAFKKPTGTLFG